MATLKIEPINIQTCICKKDNIVMVMNNFDVIQLDFIKKEFTLAGRYIREMENDNGYVDIGDLGLKFDDKVEFIELESCDFNCLRMSLKTLIRKTRFFEIN